MKSFWQNSNDMEFAQSMINNSHNKYQDGVIEDAESSSNFPEQSRKIKRFRSAFTTDQINYLEKEFKKFPYIGNVHRKEVAAALKLSERAVKIWFQNRRMKEKKDTNTKDYDEDQINISPIKNARNQLNNGNMTRSTNDQKVCPLPILINKNLAKDDNHVTTNDKISSNNITTPIKMNLKESKYIPNQWIPSTITNNPDSVFNTESPVNNFSTKCSMDLSKKYKGDSDTYIKIKEPNVISHKVEINKNLGNCSKYSNVPEDLTSRKRRELSPEQRPVKKVVANPEYIPVLPNYYSSPYVAPGGVIWNPINIMPVMPAGGTASISNSHNGLPFIQDNVEPKMCCTCNCHVKTYPVPFTLQQSNLSPQYVITALPLQNPSPKL